MELPEFLLYAPMFILLPVLSVVSFRIFSKRAKRQRNDCQYRTAYSEKTLHVKFHSIFSSISSDGHFHTVYDPEPLETAVEGPSKLEIANANEEKDDSETPLKAPTGRFQHKHLMAGMFITVVYEVKGKR